MFKIRKRLEPFTYLITLWIAIVSAETRPSNTIIINPSNEYQTIVGFGAALAFYDKWLIAHPNKPEIYDAIFNELSLDILRVRNAHEYDTTMINRVVEFCDEAEASLGHKIKLLSTSWGPPARLKSNNDPKNGGTLIYSINNNKVEFDYSGFADWWQSSLQEYSDNGVYPDYISIQNEPDFTAKWESCRFDPSEKVTSTDTIAGYDRALEAVYNSFTPESKIPKILGPELVGIGYGKLQKYVDALDTSLIDGIAHHLYHGVDKSDPWLPNELGKTGNILPEIPHFQTEYGEGDWFSTAGLIYNSLVVESVAAYLFWDLIWNKRGLVELDNPWNKDTWTYTNGYHKSKEFYVFKQFSAFIHPGWKRIGSSTVSDSLETAAFINSSEDSLSLIIINRSESIESTAGLEVSGYTIKDIASYRTSENENCITLNETSLSSITVPKRSITTATLQVDKTTSNIDFKSSTQVRNLQVRQNRNQLAFIHNNEKVNSVELFTINGCVVRRVNVQSREVSIDIEGLSSGIYYYKAETNNGDILHGITMIY